MLGGGVDAATLVVAIGTGPPLPDCRWGRRPHLGQRHIENKTQLKANREMVRGAAQRILLREERTM